MWQRFLEFYRERRQVFLNGPTKFAPDVDWPPAWFRPIEGLTTTATGNTMTLEWSTGKDLTGYHVAYFDKQSSNQAWWETEWRV